MKLFITPGACSLSPHIVLREAELAANTVTVDLATKKLADGGDYLAVNPKGQVPALRLEDGEILTEASVIVQYLADQRPDKSLIPQAGTLARYRVQEWLNFVGSELHKSFTPLFRPNTPENYKPVAKDVIATKLTIVDRRLGDKRYLMGESFTVADAYLFTILRWAPPNGIDLGRWPNVAAYVDRVSARPAVQTALREEGLA